MKRVDSGAQQPGFESRLCWRLCDLRHINKPLCASVSSSVKRILTTVPQLRVEPGSARPCPQSLVFISPTLSSSSWHPEFPAWGQAEPSAQTLDSENLWAVFTSQPVPPPPAWSEPPSWLAWTMTAASSHPPASTRAPLDSILHEADKSIFIRDKLNQVAPWLKPSPASCCTLNKIHLLTLATKTLSDLSPSNLSDCSFYHPLPSWLASLTSLIFPTHQACSSPRAFAHAVPSALNYLGLDLNVTSLERTFLSTLTSSFIDGIAVYLSSFVICCPSQPGLAVSVVSVCIMPFAPGPWTRAGD